MGKFLLIGPSGVGKSTALKILSNNQSIEIYDLDVLIKKELRLNSLSNYLKEIGNEKFFYKSKEIVEKINNEKNIVIAIGAGSIDFVGGHQWFLNQDTIAITGNPDIIYKRSDRLRFHPTIELYKSSEFSEQRQHLYENSKYIIDSSEITPQQVANRIATIMEVDF